MKRSFFPAALLLVLAVCFGCGTSRFIIYKNGKAYYFASRRKGLYRMLCDSGDFKKVLERSSIPADAKRELYRYNCVEPSADRVQAIFVALTPEQRESIRLAFVAQGYEINYFPCG